jgi:hypothetical protein
MRQHRCCQSSMTRMIVLSHEPDCSRRDSFRNNSRVLQRRTPPPSGGCARLRRRMVARRLSVAGGTSAVTVRQSARRKMTPTGSTMSIATMRIGRSDRMSICGSAGPEIRTFQSNLSHVIRSRREVGGSHPRMVCELFAVVIEWDFFCSAHGSLYGTNSPCGGDARNVSFWGENRALPTCPSIGEF